MAYQESRKARAGDDLSGEQEGQGGKVTYQESRKARAGR